MLITILILLALLLAISIWLTYRNLAHPYLRPAKPLPVTAQWQFERRARQQLTKAATKLSGLYWLTVGLNVLGALLIVISAYNLETKLNLLLFPTGTAITSVIMLVSGVLLLLVQPLVWPTQSYDYWLQHVSAESGFSLSTTKDFKHYRLQRLWSVLALDGFVLVAWIGRALTTSTEPVLVIEYLIVCALAAIPVVALITLLVQLPYLYQSSYLEVKPDAHVKFGQLHYQANRELIKQQPDLKKRLITVLVLRVVAYLLVVVSLWTLYANILAPAFTVDTAAVFPAAIYALITLVILETIGALWPTKLYDYLRLLKTDQLPFKVSGSDRFAKFHYHLYYYHLSAGIVWLVAWLLAVGAYYYFG